MPRKTKTILLNESDRNLAAQGLQLAASKYTEIANSFSDVPNLKAQFEKQASDATRIAMLIWDAMTIGLAVEEPSEEDCDCNDRSWYGENHDSACPLAGQAR